MKARISAVVLAAFTAVALGLMTALPASAATTAGAHAGSFYGDYFEYSTISPDKSLIAYSDEGGSKVTILNTVTGVATDVADPGADIDEPGGLVFTPDGSTLYVANYYGWNVVVIDLSTMQVTGTLESSDFVGGPWNLAISPDGTKLYVTSYLGAELVTYNLTNDATSTVPIATMPYSMAISNDGSSVYVVSYYGIIDVLDTASGQISHTWTSVSDNFPGKTIINNCINPDSTVLYLPELDGTGLHAVSLIDGSILHSATGLSLSGGIASCAVSPDGASVFVTDYNVGGVSGDHNEIVEAPGVVYEFSTAALSQIATIQLDGVAYTNSVNFISDCTAVVAGSVGNAQKIDTGACNAGLASTGAPEGVISGGATGGIALLGLGAVAVALNQKRRNHRRNQQNS